MDAARPNECSPSQWVLPALLCTTFADGQWPTPVRWLSQYALDGHLPHELKALIAHEGQRLARQVEAFVEDLVAIFWQPWIVTGQRLLRWKGAHCRVRQGLKGRRLEVQLLSCHRAVGEGCSTHRRSVGAVRSRWASQSHGCSRSAVSCPPARSQGCRCTGWWCPPAARGQR